MVAVENLTFGVPHGEVFTLLRPKSAGKTATINMIREARSHLGVPPQLDAMDLMTVTERLRFYFQIPCVEDVEHNVFRVIRAVGLEAFQTRMGEILSGGNKRKLSLSTALTGNSTVLLSESSSGMGAASKWTMAEILKLIPERIPDVFLLVSLSIAAILDEATIRKRRDSSN
ncbi:hypothetical protein B9Z19DRAFT_1126388 [Tuber borchii]|uniref:ABC transporter domain-containing protein n=1 Tax=Tuber borchii TaxID=42251 RepID=A0A2T6ZT34_TUBBO|nr:hypothetical protein B9Z19DRAFT_1126388 [Tuber borchii]